MPSHLPAVTILSGFLGAGKTSLLQHLLTNRGAASRDLERPWAAVVNDLAALNIDGRLIENAGASRVVELANGCVCCTVRDELAETIAELAASGRYGHLFVETSGVAEPRRVAGLFTRPNAFGRKLSDFARLHALVTVVDAAQWRAAWRSFSKPHAAGTSRPRKSGEEKAPIELMLEQIECADLLVLNKTDLVSPAELSELSAALRGLNTRAEIVPTHEARIPLGLLPGPPRFCETETLGAAKWLKVLGATSRAPLRTPQLASTGERGPNWQTLVFRERAPFSEEKLRAFFAEQRPREAGETAGAGGAGGAGGLIRAKGFFWVKERAADMGYLSLAGEVLRWDYVGTWAAALLERGLIGEAEVPAHARVLWAEPHGDRRQELVFIGLDFDPETLRETLHSCLS